MSDQEISLRNQIFTFFTKDKSISALAVKAIVGSIIMAIFAQITIPLPLIPITGQTLGLTIVALSMGKKTGTVAIVLYIIGGALGLPVFAGGKGGVAILLGPSGGYLWGFIPSAFIMGYFADKGCLNSFIKSAIAVSLGTITTIIFGLAQLSLFVPFSGLLNAGLIPFIPGAIIKSMIAIITLPTAHRLISKIK